jgi:arylformamidase
MPKIYDITPLLSPKIGIFPGDKAFEQNVVLEISKGHNIGLSWMATSMHVGAHADAPNHYLLGGAGIHERDLTRYFGRCLVLHAKVPKGERVSKQHLSHGLLRQSEGQTGAPMVTRVLIRTESFPDPDHWNSDFNSYDPALIEEWALAGVKTIGIDTPSIDPETSKDLPSHAVVAKYDLSILEGLVLTDVPEGFYTLIALPLKIENADAAPVRAILVADEGRAFN